MAVVGQKPSVGVTFQFLLMVRPLIVLSARYSASNFRLCRLSRSYLAERCADFPDVTTKPAMRRIGIQPWVPKQ